MVAESRDAAGDAAGLGGSRRYNSRRLPGFAGAILPAGGLSVQTPALRGAQRRFLRAQAHHLQPAVVVGKQGLTPALLAALDEALTAHELIKVRFGDFKDERKALSQTLAEQTGSHLAGLIGHVAILYRPHPDPKERKLRLPQPPAGTP